MLRYSHKETLTYGATVTIDHSKGYNQYKLTLTGNAELLLTNFNDTDTLLLLVYQDGTGGRTLELDGAQIPLNAGINAVTLIGLVRDGSTNVVDSSAPPIPDTTAPTVVSATAIDATTIRVVFDEIVLATNVGWSFKKNGGAHNPSAVSGSGTNTLDFTVGTMLETDTILRSYDDTTGDTTDQAENELASFTDSGVTNDIPTTWQDISWTGADLSEASNVWSTSGSDAVYGHTGLGDFYLPSGQDGSIRTQHKSDGKNQMIGFNTVNAATGHAGFECGYYVNASNVLVKKDGGTTTSTGITITVDHYVRLNRTGSVWKLQTSADGTNWTDQHTLTYAGTGDMYTVCDFTGSTQKMYYPMAFNLSLS